MPAPRSSAATPDGSFPATLVIDCLVIYSYSTVVPCVDLQVEDHALAQHGRCGAADCFTHFAHGCLHVAGFQMRDEDLCIAPEFAQFFREHNRAHLAGRNCQPPVTIAERRFDDDVAQTTF